MSIIDKKVSDIFRWHKVKARIHLSKDKSFLFCYEKDVWWASLGSNIGYEEDGKNNNFERPVLIIKKINKHLVLVIPLSSRLKENNKYYYKFFLNNEYRSAILSQIRIISSKRLNRRIGRVSDDDIFEIKNIVKNFI